MKKIYEKFQHIPKQRKYSNKIVCTQSLSFKNYQFTANLTSAIVLCTSPPPEHFEANTRHHIILFTDFSICISKI